MKVIVLFTRRNVGLIALSYLVSKKYKVKVVSDDENVLWLANDLKCEVVTMQTMGEHDMILSVHWHKVIPKEYLQGVCVNVHPLLFKYKGKNPVEKYIKNKDTLASVQSHYMTEVVDEGEEICGLFFDTPVCNTYAEFYNIAFPYYPKLLEKTLKIVL